MIIKVGICYREVSNKSELTQFTSINEPTQEVGRAQGKLTKQPKESKCFRCSNHRIPLSWERHIHVHAM